MSEQEKLQEQGRAHAELKKARSNAATLVCSLGFFKKELEQVASLITRFTESSASRDAMNSLLTALDSLQTQPMRQKVIELQLESETANYLGACPSNIQRA